MRIFLHDFRGSCTKDNKAEENYYKLQQSKIIVSRQVENLIVNSPYPGTIVDIAGMDYSLARRKPPIHN